MMKLENMKWQGEVEEHIVQAWTTKENNNININIKYKDEQKQAMTIELHNHICHQAANNLTTYGEIY